MEDAKLILRQRYSDLYSLSQQEAAEELEMKHQCMESWRGAEVGTVPFSSSVPMLREIFAKLRRGKGSPDGCTAKMYSALPDKAVAALAEYLSHIMATLDVPFSWTAVSASLIPKHIGAADLDKFRGIACLSTSRKILGHSWMQMVPRLRFESSQNGFVKGMHASDGGFVLKRAAEL